MVVRTERLRASPRRARRLTCIDGGANEELPEPLRALRSEELARSPNHTARAAEGRTALAACGKMPAIAILPGGLTGRQAEVIALIADGSSNHEIAEKLVLSEATVERHVANVYAKLGVRSRAEATRYAIRHGLAVAPGAEPTTIRYASTWSFQLRSPSETSRKMGLPELREVLGALDDMVQPGGDDEFDRALLSAVLALAPADSAVATSFGSTGHRVCSFPEEFFPVADQLVFEEINRLQPWPLATHTRAGAGRALRISDVLSTVKYRSHTVYSELFRSLEIEHQVAFSVPLGIDRTLCVVMNRTFHDFSPADLEVLDALRGLVVALGRRTDSEASAHKLTLAELSHRERDVMALVAHGMTDGEVGRRLAISVRTVSKHLEHVYTKLGVDNRTKAAAWWNGARP